MLVLDLDTEDMSDEGKLRIVLTALAVDKGGW